MAKGKYEAEQRRFYWVGIFACISLLLLAAAVIALVGTAPSKTDGAPSSTPGASSWDTQSSQVTSEATTETTTEATTEAATETTTEATTESTEALPPEYNEAVGNSIAAVAEALVGKPYVYGSAGPDGFDTTGLIYYCFREYDIPAPRGLDEQFAYGTQVAREFLQPGDVVFFSLETPGVAEYVGIYTGNDTFIAVSSSRNVVEERTMSNVYFADRFVGARRYSEME